MLPRTIVLTRFLERHLQLITDTSYLIKENAATHSNAPICLNSTNSETQFILPSTEINAFLLPSYSPKSNKGITQYNRLEALMQMLQINAQHRLQYFELSMQSD